MKKSFVRLLFLFAFVSLLCSCGSISEAKPDLTLPFSIRLQESASNSVFFITAKESGCSAEFFAPPVLEGAVLKRDKNGSATVAMGDFERNATKEQFPFFFALEKALSPLGQEDFLPSAKNGLCGYTIDGMTVMVYYDILNGFITKIETEEQGQKFVFESIPAADNEAQSKSTGGYAPDPQ